MKNIDQEKIRQSIISYHNLQSVFQNPRINLTLTQLIKHKKSIHKSCEGKTKYLIQTKQNKQKETFRSFAKSRRSYQPCNERQTFIKLKQELEQLVFYVENSKTCIDISRVTELKQKILLNFLNAYVGEVSKQNLDKAELLVIIWNNLFLLVEKSLEMVCEFAKKNESTNLKQQIDMHHKYQKILEENIKQKQEMKQQSQKRQKFMRILVSKLREYKKSIKKLQQNLRIAAQKLNQFRRGYLQIQIQCINLNMQYRNLGEQTAKSLIKRKMALIIQKSKQYKILPSRTKMRKQLKAQKIQPDSVQNKDIKTQFYEGFLTNINEGEMLPKAVGRIIQTILDNQETEPIDYSIFNEKLVENKYLNDDDMKVDQQTDMNGFQIQKADKKIGINSQQRFYYQMVRMRGTQTVSFEKPVIEIKKQTTSSQCDFKLLKINRFSFKKSFDLSFLFENTKKSHANIRQQEIQKNFILAKNKNSDKQLGGSQDFMQINSQLQFQNEQISRNQDHQRKNWLKNKKKTIQRGQWGQREERGQSGQREYREQISLQYPEVILVKRRIKKLASTFSNKISFINNINSKQRHRRYTKENLNDTFQQNNLKPGAQNQDQTHNDLISIDENTEFFFKQTKKSQKFIQRQIQKQRQKQRQGQKLKDVSMGKIKIKKKNQKNQQQTQTQRKSLKSVVKKRQKSSRKSNKQLNYSKKNKADEYQQLQLQDNLKRTRSNPKSKKEDKVYKNDKKKDLEVNLQLFYKDIKQQLKKSKPSSIQFQKNSNKIKQINKIIEQALQIAWKQYQNEGRLNHFLYYVYQSLNSSFGITNNSFIKKKVITFVKQVIQLKQLNSLFKLFLLMIELDDNNEHNLGYCQKNNEVILRLGSRIFTNWKIPFKLNEMLLNLEMIEQKIERQLVDCGFSQISIYSLVKNLEQAHSFDKNIDQFEILLRISKYFTQKQKIISHSYEPIFCFLTEDLQFQIPKKFINFLIQLHFYPSHQSTALRKKYETFCYQMNIEGDLDQSQFSYFCCQSEIVDFSRLFYRALNIFQLKQNEEIFKKISLNSLRKIETSNMPKEILDTIYTNCEKMNETNAFFHAMIKKNLLIILFLKAQETIAKNIAVSILGKNLNYFADFNDNQAL